MSSPEGFASFHIQRCAVNIDPGGLAMIRYIATRAGLGGISINSLECSATIFNAVALRELYFRRRVRADPREVAEVNKAIASSLPETAKDPLYASALPIELYRHPTKDEDAAYSLVAGLSPVIGAERAAVQEAIDDRYSAYPPGNFVWLPQHNGLRLATGRDIEKIDRLRRLLAEGSIRLFSDLQIEYGPACPSPVQIAHRPDYDIEACL